MSAQEDKTKHSPIALSSQDGGIFLEQDGEVIAELWVSHTRADAIVRAVNSHSLLVEALKAAQFYVEFPYKSQESHDPEGAFNLLEQINAALKAAEEQK